MVFSSLFFTFVFLPLVVLIYYVSKEQYRNYILVVASLLFYAYGEPKYVFLMMFSIVFNYLFGLLIDRRQAAQDAVSARLAMIASVIVNVGLLFVFKYLNYSVLLFSDLTGYEVQYPDIKLPIGISFFTFQAMSYCIDVYRQKVKVQKNLLYVALYISFFPQLIAGPIVRYSTIEEQIKSRTITADDVAEGIRRFFLGFSKKVILANNLAVVAKEVFAKDPAEAGILMLWIGSIAYTLQIFYDFSGYSDMAIGLGRMFGFKFLENFNYPYISKSITEFWRRWHISLGTWFRDYVYIPLGGSRVKLPRIILNLFIVWFLTGMWHGANVTFIVWGLFYFVMLVIEKWIVKPDKRNVVFSILWQIVTLLSVNFAWVIFNSDYISSGMNYIKGMLGLYGADLTITPEISRIFTENRVFFIAAILFATPVVPKLRERFSALATDNVKKVSSVIVPILYCFAFLWSVSYLILGFHNPFIYFNF